MYISFDNKMLSSNHMYIHLKSNNIADSFYEVKQYKKAINSYQRALELGCKIPSAYLFKGRSHVALFQINHENSNENDNDAKKNKRSKIAGKSSIVEHDKNEKKKGNLKKKKKKGKNSKKSRIRLMMMMMMMMMMTM